jgi:hypothetical protein
LAEKSKIKPKQVPKQSKAKEAEGTESRRATRAGRMVKKVVTPWP